MTEEELLYHYPYRLDKEFSLRHYSKNDKDFVRRYIPNYDGTNIEEFITNKSNLTKAQIVDFDYIYKNFHNWTDWYNNGRNIFSFSKELLSLLEKTDVSEITPDSFHLPYDIFYLSLKALNIKISRGRDEIIEGVYIDHNIWNMKGEHPEGYCDLYLTFVGDFKSVYREFYPHVISRFERKDGVFDEYQTGSFWDVGLNFEKENGIENVKQAIDYSIADLKDEIFPREGSKEPLSDYVLDFYNSSLELISNTLSLVINCLLYLSQPTYRKDVELKLPKGLPSNLNKKLSFAKTDKEIKKVEKKFEDLGFSKIHFVGQNLKRTNSKITNGYTVQTHWRRGHWRNQKIGEALSESKLIWILPTIVNSDKGEPEKGHLYDMKDQTRNH